MNQPFLWFCFFSLLIMAQTEAACRKRGRADKNEEGQPFYAFTKQICCITHAYLTCLKRQCSNSFVCFGLGFYFLFLFFFKPELSHTWFGSVVAEMTHVECHRGTTNQSKSQWNPGSCLFKALIALIAFSHPHEPDLPFTVVTVAHPSPAQRCAPLTNFLICQFVDPARTTF